MTSTTLYADFASIADQSEELNSLTLLLQRRIKTLRQTILTAVDIEEKIDAMADMIAVSAALSSLAVSSAISSREISDYAKRLLQ